MKKSQLFKLIFILIAAFCLTSCGDDVEPVHIHTWSGWAVVEGSTCAKEGLKVRHCMDEDCDVTDEVTLNCSAHTFNEGKILKESTCNEEGEMEFECSVCKKIAKQKIPTLDHEIIVVEGKPADCYNDGLTDGAICKLCNKVILEQQQVKALGHAWGEPKVSIKATCYQEGKETISCTICTITKTITTEKLAHDLEYPYIIESNCLNGGSTGRGYCTICEKEVTQSKKLMPLGHNFVEGSCIRCHQKESVEGMKFKKVNGKYYLSDIGSEAVGTVYIPLMYNNEYVEGILKGAFDQAGVINIVGLSEKITDIQTGAFDNCQFLFDIEISENNPKYYVENSCLIDRETNVLLVGSADGNIPEGVREINAKAFYKRIGLITIDIPASVEKIAEDAFLECENLMGISVDSENKIYYSQDECLLLKESNLLLLGCQESIISEGIEIIGTGAFANCSSLMEINLPSTITTIMPGAFTNCQFVTSLHISENVTELVGAFEGMISLSKITVSPNNPKYEVVDGCLMEKKTKKLVLADNRGIIPEGTEIIGTGAFAGNRTLFTLVLPESVKELEPRAFADCYNLEEVVFNKNITAISDECFSGCEMLEFIEIPRYITSIGKKAFKGCISFERLELRNTMKYVGEGAFDDCVRLYIVCEAKEQPDSWDANWNPDNRAVLWGHYVVD